MTDSEPEGLGWHALTRATDALQSSDLFRARAAPDLNQTAYYGPAGVIILVFIITKVAHAFDIGSYRRLELHARLALVNRALFGLVYLVSFAPYTISAYFIFFSSTSGDGTNGVVADGTSSHGQHVHQLESWALRLVSCLLGVQLSMHVYEAGTRAVVDVDYFLILHHIVQCALPVLAFQSESPFVLKLTVVISCFASYEFLLHAALICSKMPLLRSWFYWLTLLGLILYSATRVLQTFLIVLLFKVGFGPMNTQKAMPLSLTDDQSSTQTNLTSGHSAATIVEYWIALLMAVVITAAQLWKLVVYRHLWCDVKAAANPVRTSSGTIKMPRSFTDTATNLKGLGSYSSDPPPQGKIKSMLSSLTRAASSELADDPVDTPGVKLNRIRAANADNKDICSSQNILMDNIIEDVPSRRSARDNSSAAADNDDLV